MERAEQYVTDLATSVREQVAADADLGTDSLVVRYPFEAIQPLGQDWTWRATLTIDGAEVSRVDRQH